MKRRLDEEKRGEVDDDDVDLTLSLGSAIKLGSFALLMHNDDLRKREGLFLHLHDMFRSADEPYYAGDAREGVEEAFYERYDDDDHDHGDEDYVEQYKRMGKLKKARKKISAASAASSTSTSSSFKQRRPFLRRSFRASTAPTTDDAAAMPASPASKRSLVGDLLDTIANNKEPFAMRLARLKSRFFGAL